LPLFTSKYGPLRAERPPTAERRGRKRTREESKAGKARGSVCPAC
jgi:hypothetical protein